MFGAHNPYEASVDALNEAILACERAIMVAQDLPPTRGRSDIWDAADSAPSAVA